MYNTFDEAINGFAKNFFKGFNTNKLLFSLLLILLFVLFAAPIVFYLINDIFLIIILMILLERIFVSVLSKQTGMINVVLHPVQMFLMLLIGIKSLRGNRLEWKGRSI
jgi:chlorobactene glucosyltransferase